MAKTPLPLKESLNHFLYGLTYGLIPNQTASLSHTPNAPFVIASALPLGFFLIASALPLGSFNPSLSLQIVLSKRCLPLNLVMLETEIYDAIRKLGKGIQHCIL